METYSSTPLKVNALPDPGGDTITLKAQSQFHQLQKASTVIVASPCTLFPGSIG
jgi:hypothetical protein